MAQLAVSTVGAGAVFAGSLVVAVAVLIRGGGRSASRLRALRRLRGSRALPASERTLRSRAGSLAEGLPTPPGWLCRAASSAALTLDPRVLWAGWLATAALAGLSALGVGGPGLVVVSVAVVAAVPLALLRSRRGRSDEIVERALPVALEEVARSLRSGVALRQAVDEAARTTPGPLGADLRLAAAEAAQGRGLVSALESLATRRPLPGVKLTVAALCVGIEAGGANARAVDGVAATLRERFALAGEVRALAAQARMSALVIGVAPVAFGAFATASDPDLADFVLRTPLGLAILAAGLALDGAGWLWMNRLSQVRG